MTEPPKQITTAKDTASPLLTRYGRALSNLGGFPATFDSSNTLIPAEDLPGLIGEIEATLRPATKRQVAETIALIAGAWPHAHQKAEEGALMLFVHQLEEDLAEFPADILHETVRVLRRTLRFPPAISEIYEAATMLVDNRRTKLRAARNHQNEHERRAAEIRPCAEKLSIRDRAMLARIDRLHELYGFTCTLADVDNARNAMWAASSYMFNRWMEAMEACEYWVAVVMPIAVVASRVIELWDAGNLTTEQSERLIKQARHDLSGARQGVVQAEADAEVAKASIAGDFAPGQSMRRDPRSGSAANPELEPGHPASVLEAIVEEIGQECRKATA